MSYHTLQRLVVRLLFDPVLVEQVYREPDTALAGLDLNPAERAQLLAIDPRAWRTDPLRRLRTLRTLVEEFKTSTTLVLAETRALASLDRFFSSAFFHQSVQQRGSMGLAFAQFIADAQQRGELRTPQLADVLRLETTMARCRRDLAKNAGRAVLPVPETVSDQMRVRLAPGHDVGAFQANLIATIQQIEKYLFEVNLMPAMALCDDAPRLGHLPAVESKKKSYLLFTPAANGISLVDIERADYLVLIEARATLPIRQLLERALAAGVSRPKANEIISQALDQQFVEIIA